MVRLHPQIQAYLELLGTRCRALYGDNLLSLVLYGSVVRGTFRPTSDIDLLVLLRRSTLSWGKRISQLLNAILFHPDVRMAAARLRQLNLPSRVEPLILTESELATHPPILLDLTEEAMILEDHAGAFAGEIARVRTRLGELGARRVWLSGDRWYWVLTPEIRPGEIITV